MQFITVLTIALALGLIAIVASVLINRKANRRFNRRFERLCETVEELEEWKWNRLRNESVQAEIDDKTIEAIKKGKTVYYELHCSATGEMFLTRCKRQ